MNYICEDIKYICEDMKYICEDIKYICEDMKYILCETKIKTLPYNEKLKLQKQIRTNFRIM